MSAPNGIWLNKIYLREESREVDDLAAALDALDEAETDDGPGGGQAAHQLGLETAEVVPGGVLLQPQHRPLEVVLARRHSLVNLNNKLSQV